MKLRLSSPSRDKNYEALRDLHTELDSFNKVMEPTIAPKRKLKRDKPKATRSGV